MKNFLNYKTIIFYIILSLCWLITRFPYKCIFYLGKGIGYIGYIFLKKTRKIATININLCFHNFSQKEKNKLIKGSFISLGIGIMENMIAWLVRIEKLPNLEVEGEEYLQKEIAMGNGIILLGAHQSSFELVAQIFQCVYPLHVVYKERINSLINKTILRFRESNGAILIPSYNIKEMLQVLRAKKILWVVADQAPKKKRHTVFAPFFGINTSSYTSISTLSKLSNAAVFPVSCYRTEKNNSYCLKIYPKLNQFPSLTKEKDALKTNQAFEKIIMSSPEQYLWLYKKFKVTEDGSKNVYDQK